MRYKIYKFRFLTGVHLGKKSLDESEYTIGADTIFSALCHEYSKQGKEHFYVFLENVMQRKIIFSDALPYIGDN